MAPADQSDDTHELARWDPDPRQLDMFGPPTRNPDPGSVRTEPLDLLAKARAAPDASWDSKKASHYRAIFPQMANVLPAEEAAQLRLEFTAELARLEP